MPNPVVQFQIIASDPEKVANFYRDVFGWKVRSDNALGYRQLMTEAGRGIEGGVWPSPTPVRDFVQLFMEVDDVEATIHAAKEKGAQVLVPRSELPDGDVMAILIDPSGMSFGLVSRR